MLPRLLGKAEEAKEDERANHNRPPRHLQPIGEQTVLMPHYGWDLVNP